MRGEGVGFAVGRGAAHHAQRRRALGVAGVAARRRGAQPHVHQDVYKRQPYILAHLIDEVVPLRSGALVALWGALMILTAVATRQFNVCANRIAVDNAHRVSYDVRQALFTKTANLSGTQFDAFGLPSLISRMTSDS